MAYTKYSLTPADNNAAPPNGAPEGMLPSAVNDTMRDMMAQIRDCGDGIRGGTYTMTAPVITGGSISGATGAFTTLTASGNTVIGGTSASGKFTITGYSSSDTAKDIAIVRSSSSTAVQVAPNITFIDGTTNNTVAIQAGSGNLQFWNYGSGSWIERMRINSSGNVVVGSGTSQGARFEVVSGQGNGIRITATGTTTGDGSRLIFSNQLSSGYGDLSTIYQDLTNAGSGGTADLVFATSSAGTGGNRMRITGAGDVGIGTSTPASKLAIVSANNEGIYTTNGTQITKLFNASGISAGALWTISNHALSFGTNNTERMRIDSSGRVLIGTTSASAGVALKVAGGIIGAIDVYNNTTASAANMFIDSSGFFARSTSSLKYKTDIQDATHGLAEVLKLRSVTYKGKTDGETVLGGLIAEEVDAAGLTEFVQYAEDGSPDALAYGQMVSLAFKAIQELKEIVDQQSTELDSVKAELQTLKGN